MTTSDILEQLLSNVPDNYDKDPGSFFYDLLFPVAEQLSVFAETLAEIEASAFAKTATGQWLDYKVAEQGLERHSSGYATGTVRISGSTGAMINAGSLVASDDLIFETDETVTVPEIGYVDVGATCTAPGTAGNVGVGKIYRFPITLPGVTSVYNPQTFSGGIDAETDDDLRQRYFDKVSRPNVSGNKYQYQTWAREVDGVGNAWVVPLWDGPGTVKVIITDSNNQPASSDLIAEVQAYIDTMRPIGANVTVASVSTQPVNIFAFVVTDGRLLEDVQTDIETAVAEYLAGEASANNYVSYAKVCGLMMSVDGVVDINQFSFFNDLDINITSGIRIPEGYVPILGEVTLGEDASFELAGGGGA